MYGRVLGTTEVLCQTGGIVPYVSGNVCVSRSLHREHTGQSKESTSDRKLVGLTDDVRTVMRFMKYILTLKNTLVVSLRRYIYDQRKGKISSSGSVSPIH